MPSAHRSPREYENAQSLCLKGYSQFKLFLSATSVVLSYVTKGKRNAFVMQFYILLWEHLKFVLCKGVLASIEKMTVVEFFIDTGPVGE